MGNRPVALDDVVVDRDDVDFGFELRIGLLIEVPNEEHVDLGVLLAEPVRKLASRKESLEKEMILFVNLRRLYL